MASHAQFNTTAPSGSDQHWKVAAQTSKTLILSASVEQRTHASIFNASPNNLYLKFGDNTGIAVSGSSGLFDVKLTSASYFEIPKPAWQGEIWGAWDADLPAGFALVLQLGRTDK
jgi:hypothetical protein